MEQPFCPHIKHLWLWCSTIFRPISVNLNFLDLTFWLLKMFENKTSFDTKIGFDLYVSLYILLAVTYPLSKSE